MLAVASSAKLRQSFVGDFVRLGLEQFAATDEEVTPRTPLQRSILPRRLAFQASPVPMPTFLFLLLP